MKHTKKVIKITMSEVNNQHMSQSSSSRRQRRQRRASDSRLTQSMTANSGMNSRAFEGDGEPDETTSLINNAARRHTTVMARNNNSRSSLRSSFLSFMTMEDDSDESEGKKKSTSSTPCPDDMYITTLKAATNHIFGLYGVEVWQFDDTIDLLQSIPLESSLEEENGNDNDDEENPTKPHQTLYIRRPPQESDENSPSFELSAKEAYEQLTDPTHIDYLPKHSTRPGVGLAGVLWSEAALLGGFNISKQLQNVNRRISVEQKKKKRIKKIMV